MKILVTFTGGTIACTNSNGNLHTDNNNSFLLLDNFSKKDNSVEFIVDSPFMILSENLNFNNLYTLYDCIKEYLNYELDGIIVTHGTDTLQYTSSFLGYAFSDIDIPLVLVSANYPLADKRSNGLSNFIAAVEFIRSKSGKGVFTAYTNSNEISKIHRATRLLPHQPYSDKIESFFNNFYGNVENSVFIKNSEYSEQANELHFKNICNDSLSVLKIAPYPDMIYPKLGDNIKAVLLESYHSGTISTSSISLKNFCKNADKLNIPIFLTGSCSGFDYESKSLFKSLKIQVLPPASPIAMYVKLKMLYKDNIEKVFLPCGGDFLNNLS